MANLFKPRLSVAALLSFIWRGTCYQVHTSPGYVASAGSLVGRWGRGGSESDRTYYRLDCSGDLQCDVYFDAATGIWILDRVHD